nr:MAG: hypothetical protein 3 [Luteoviridae sp.]
MVKRSATKKAVRVAKRAPSRPASFGPVSAINTAPVSVGNSVRGCAPRVSQTVDGARVVGRDFAFALSATASAVTGWELIGGMPITPCALPSSILRNYCQMFSKFKVNSLVVHYITSSPTSQAGDVLFYFERDSLSPMMDYSNSSFLPYTLSDPHTVIGPQWTNHTMQIKPVSDWKSTLYGMETDINEQNAGSFFMFSKTNAANSPGYLLIDYDISFRSLSVNPRSGIVPIARAQSQFVCFTFSGTTTAGNSAGATITTGKTIANATSALPTGYTAGDIYKCVFQITASTQVNAAWSGTPTPTTANLLQYADGTALALDDGFTCYTASNDGTTFFFSPTLENIVAQQESLSTGSLEYQTTFTVSLTANVCAELQLVRNIDSMTQSAY